MGKIMKYEWRKQRSSRVIILFLWMACLLGFTFGSIFEHEMLAVTSVLFMIFGSFLVIFYVGIESLLVLNKDLRTKQSHMLWMLPKSVFEILGAKFLAAILQMLFVFVAFSATGCASVLILFATMGELKLLFERIAVLTKQLFQVNVDWSVFFLFMFWAFLAWTLVIMTGFLAIIISRTLLLNSKFSGIFSVILFFLINYVVEYIYVLMDNYIIGDSGFLFSIFSFGYYIVACAILFLISGVLADKKLSV